MGAAECSGQCLPDRLTHLRQWGAKHPLRVDDSAGAFLVRQDMHID